MSDASRLSPIVGDQPTDGIRPNFTLPQPPHLIGQSAGPEGVDDRSFNAERRLFAREAVRQDVDLGRSVRATEDRKDRGLSGPLGRSEMDEGPRPSPFADVEGASGARGST